jgi:hypothetical protein
VNIPQSPKHARTFVNISMEMNHFYWWKITNVKDMKIWKTGLLFTGTVMRKIILGQFL